MPRFEWVTAGESHGKGLTAVVSGVPAGLPLEPKHVNVDLARRQKGYGRGGRMKIESDAVEFLAGVRAGFALGSPISMWIQNRDWKNWSQIMSPEPDAVTDRRTMTRPRPGHADLVGGLKYNHKDLRNVLERASARETAARSAVGGIAKRLLDEFNIKIFSAVLQIGPVKADVDINALESNAEFDDSPLRCPDKEAEQKMMEYINQRQRNGDTCGGVAAVIARGVPPGLGSHTAWDRKMDGRIAQAMTSIQAIKGVSIGEGMRVAGVPGSEAHDEIFYDNDRRAFYRETNRAGGLEGGVTNGMPVVAQIFMKPISTLARPLQSVDIQTKEPFIAQKERTDSCAVPAAGVVGEAMMAIVLAQAMLDKFGGDSVSEMKRNVDGYLEYARNF